MKVIYKGEQHSEMRADYEAGKALIKRCDSIDDKPFWVRLDEIEEYHGSKAAKPDSSTEPKKTFIFFPKNDFEKHIGKLCDELKETLIKKNRDYGDSFSKLYNEYGDVSTAIRLSDKLDRFKNLIDKENLVKDESKNDTLKDLAGYSVLTLAIKRMG